MENRNIRSHFVLHKIIDNWYTINIDKLFFNTSCCQIGGATTSITEWWEVAPCLHHLDYQGWALGSLPGWPKIGFRRQSGPLAPYQAWRSPHPGPRAGENISRADTAVPRPSRTVAVILCHPSTIVLLTHELYIWNKTWPQAANNVIELACTCSKSE